MNYPVAIKGVDPNNAVIIPSTSIKVPGGVAKQVKLCTIDMYAEPQVTQRKITIEKDAPLSMAFINFHIRMLNSSINVGKRMYNNTTGMSNDGYPVSDNYLKEPNGNWSRYMTANVQTPYPQKHIIDVEIKGANGANGFLPSAYGVETVAHIQTMKNKWNGNVIIPTTLASIFNVYTRHRDGIETSGEGSALAHYQGNWQISEHEWWSYVSNESDANFDPAILDQIYTRGCDMQAVMTVLSDKTRAQLNLYRYFNMFYADANVFTIRVTMEFKNAREKKIKFEKFTQSALQLS